MVEPIDLKGYATNGILWWNYPPEKMPPVGVKLHILTTGGVAVHSTWRWDAGFIGWQFLPRRDILAEEAAIDFINNGEHK